MKCASIKRGQRVGALDIAAQLNELPSFAVTHGAVGDALKKVRAFLHRVKKRVRLLHPRLFRPGSYQHSK